MLPVSRKAWYSSIKSMKIRGTSRLFRWNSALFEMLKSQTFYGPMERAVASEKVFCLQCRREECSLARHVVTLSSTGNVIRPTKLNEIPQQNMSISRRAARKRSEETFSAAFYCNQLIDLIQEYNKSPSSSAWTSRQTRLDLMPKLVQLCSEAKALLASEPRVVRIRSPVWVMGDIHGNLPDLMTCADVLWRSAPSRLAAHYLFLGDYVDVSQCSFFINKQTNLFS